MNTLTGIVITKNEEHLIKDCLRSLTFCDEVVVVDNESSDQTVAISKKVGAHVYLYKSSDFADARNYALKKITSKWILYIDADERASDTLRDSIQHVVNNSDSSYSAYRVKRQNFYLGNHKWPKIELLERLFQRSKLEKWYGKLHESPKVEGEIGTLDGFLLHYTHRNLSEMVEKTLEWSKIEAELRFEQNHPPVVWWRFPRVMVSAFWDSYVSQSGWKVGTVGVIESVYQAFSAFITYARLWEMQKKSNKQEV